ncbi:MAG: V-type ATP synthase subunit F [Lachnospiraceae bacterium]|jgi:V/A-type H+-transporting ATPase subunit F|nr:V-type ATP synthase subunit F [Lachnospiraceae bacterium]
MYKIGVMGDYDSIYGFAALGLETFPVKDPEEAKKILDTLVVSGYGIVYITEEWASILHREIEKHGSNITPAIIQIPGISGNTGAGITGVKKSVEQAVGSDILFGENN